MLLLLHFELDNFLTVPTFADLLSPGPSLSPEQAEEYSGLDTFSLGKGNNRWIIIDSRHDTGQVSWRLTY